MRNRPKDPWVECGHAGLNGGPPKCVHPEPVNVTSFGNGVFTGVIKDLEMALSWIQRGLVSSWRNRQRKIGGTDTQKGTACEDRGRNWSGISTGQLPGVPAATRASRRSQSCQRFQTAAHPEMWEVSVELSDLIGDHWLQKSSETNTVAEVRFEPKCQPGTYESHISK